MPTQLSFKASSEALIKSFQSTNALAGQVYGTMMLKAEIMRAEEVIADGDLVEMLAVYKALEETCERAL